MAGGGGFAVAADSDEPTSRGGGLWQIARAVERVPGCFVAHTSPEFRVFLKLVLAALFLALILFLSG